MPAVGRGQPQRHRLLPAAACRPRSTTRCPRPIACSPAPTTIRCSATSRSSRAAGAVRYDVALRVAARQAKSPDARVARRAYALAGAVPEALVDRRPQGAIRGVDSARFRRPRAHAGLAAAEGRHRGRAAAAQRGGERRRDSRRGHGARAQGAAARAALGRASQRDSAGSATLDPGGGRAHVGQGRREAVRRAARGRRRRARTPNEREDVYRALGAFADPALMDRGLRPILAGRRALALCARRARGGPRRRRDALACARLARAQRRRRDGRAFRSSSGRACRAGRQDACTATRARAVRRRVRVAARQRRRRARGDTRRRSSGSTSASPCARRSRRSFNASLAR